MTPEEADNLEEGVELHLKYTMNGKLDVKRWNLCLTRGEAGD